MTGPLDGGMSSVRSACGTCVCGFVVVLGRAAPFHASSFRMVGICRCTWGERSETFHHVLPVPTLAPRLQACLYASPFLLEMRKEFLGFREASHAHHSLVLVHP